MIFVERVVRSVPVTSPPQLTKNAKRLGEATEEAVINSMLKATTLAGQAGRVVDAINPQDVVRVCREFGVIAKE